LAVSIEPAVRSVAAQNSSAVDLVTAEIRRAILTGALPAGRRFSIQDLARQLEVSHIPIREALRRLEGQGLIILRQARSAEVAALTVTDLDAIYRLRLRLEPQLAGQSAPLHTEQHLAKLAELLEDSRSGDPETAWAAHYAFHAELVAPAASEWDLRILGTLWIAAERYTHLVFDYTNITEDERQARYDRHALLLAAAGRHESPPMEAVLTHHLVFNQETIRSAIEALEEGVV
jgi:DNA-binding GntR family transcriptional regulator